MSRVDLFSRVLSERRLVPDEQHRGLEEFRNVIGTDAKALLGKDYTNASVNVETRFGASEFIKMARMALSNKFKGISQDMSAHDISACVSEVDAIIDSLGDELKKDLS